MWKNRALNNEDGKRRAGHQKPSSGHGVRPTCSTLKPSRYGISKRRSRQFSPKNRHQFPRKLPSVAPLNCRRSHAIFAQKRLLPGAKPKRLTIPKSFITANLWPFCKCMAVLAGAAMRLGLLFHCVGIKYRIRGWEIGACKKSHRFTLTGRVYLVRVYQVPVVNYGLPQKRRQWYGTSSKKRIITKTG